MGHEELPVFGLLLYRCFLTGAGLAIVFFSYRLLNTAARSRGKTTTPNELTVKNGAFSAILKSHTPALFFALFGSAILIISLLRPISFSVTVTRQTPGLASPSTPAETQRTATSDSVKQEAISPAPTAPTPLPIQAAPPPPVPVPPPTTKTTVVASGFGIVRR